MSTAIETAFYETDIQSVILYPGSFVNPEDEIVQVYLKLEISNMAAWENDGLPADLGNVITGLLNTTLFLRYNNYDRIHGI